MIIRQGVALNQFIVKQNVGNEFKEIVIELILLTLVRNEWSGVHIVQNVSLPTPYNLIMVNVVVSQSPAPTNAGLSILLIFYQFLEKTFIRPRALVGVSAMGAMAPTLFENMLIGTHTFF